MDPKMEELINEFGELSDQIDKINHELKAKKARFEAIEDSLAPILEAMAETEERSLETKKYLVTIKRLGNPNMKSPKYKEAFEQALTKVNKRIQTILMEALTANTGTKKIATSLGVQKIGEGVGSNLLAKLTRWYAKIGDRISGHNKEITKYNDVLRQLSQR